MRVELIAVPYDSGRRGERMGAGPERLLGGGLADDLERAGHEVVVRVIELPLDAWSGEVQSAFALAVGVGAAVRAAVLADAFPLVLSGNCAPAALGAAAALRTSPAVFWFDAHGDFNTPETTTSGFVDGMALAVLTGRCWRSLAAGLPHFAPVPESSVVLIGARDLDAAEAAALRQSDMTLLASADVRAALPTALASLDGAPPAYVHIDLDVLDAAEAKANRFAAADGLSLEALEWAVRAIAAATPVAAAALTAYEPAADTDGAAARAARAVAAALLDAAAHTR